MPAPRHTPTPPDLRSFRELTANVLRLIEASEFSKPIDQQAIRHALDGGFAEGVRASLDLDARRKDGIFFTGQSLRAALGSTLPPEPFELVVDPACGAGDLLLEAASRLALGRSVSETVWSWGQRLGGADIHADFIEATKARLILLAVARHYEEIPRRAIGSAPVARMMRTAFPHFRTIDGVQFLREISVEHPKPFSVLMNPPFSVQIMNSSYRWADGSRTVAAAFLDEVVQNLPIGSQFAAILPDVIRSGSNHESLRRSLECRVEGATIRTHGQFDRFADVDVFLFSGVKRAPGPPAAPIAWWPPGDASIGRLGDCFDVRIGTVVDNRDPSVGPSLPYIRARNLPGENEALDHFPVRSHGGRTFTGPFLLLRRTSRPVLGRTRLSPVTIEAGDHFVDNHLIVIQSRTGSLEELRALAQQLESPQVTGWLDERIRCRHLTARSIKDIPLPDC